jgi:hypothetical protein
MYSTIAGTGEDSASSGSQMRAASRAPPATGMKTFSMSRTERGKVRTVFICVSAYPVPAHLSVRYTALACAPLAGLG